MRTQNRKTNKFHHITESEQSEFVDQAEVNIQLTTQFSYR